MPAPPDGRLAAGTRNGAGPLHDAPVLRPPDEAAATRVATAHALLLDLFETVDADAITARLTDATRAAMAVDAVALLESADAAIVPEGVQLLDAPLVADGVALGLLRVARVADGPPFDDADRALLALIAAAGTAALRNARRFADADRSGDLALVMEMSRAITATLQLDRVLGAAVNIATKMLTFDRGAVALYERGQCEVRALAGVATVDPEDPSLRNLAARAAFAAGTGERFYLSDRADPASDAERIFVQLFGEDLEAEGVGGGLYLPLVDEEGVVGILLFESARPDFVDARRRELATILANQATVAIRNARLYDQVPLAETLGALGARGRALMEVPRRRRLAVVGAAVALLAAATLVRWPRRIEGETPLFRPITRAEARAGVDGVVERVLVREGEAVRRGQTLALLRDRERRAERDAASAEAIAADRAAAQAAARGDAAAESLERRRAETLRAETAVLDEQLRAVAVRSPVDGTVLTARPEERLGAGLAAGDAVLLVGRTDSLELEFGVDQRDVPGVRPGDEVRLRVDALPQRTFVGRVAIVGRVPLGDDAEVRFPVRALFANDDALLRPGMSAYARVLGAPTSALGRLLREPVRRLRLLWWRLLP